MKWTPKERLLWNNVALGLDINQIGPNKRKYFDWVSWVGEIAVEGLQKRDYNEAKYFSEFFQNILKKGSLCVQTQNEFIASGKSLEEFIFSDLFCETKDK